MAGFLFFFLKSRRKHEDEMNLKPIFTEQCGARFNLTNYSIPFVRHALYEEFVIVSSFSGVFKIPYNSIGYATVKRYLFSVGVRYFHNNSSMPEKFIVWSIRPSLVEKILMDKEVKMQ